MKLKKILASLTAAAMAVTTMAFAPLSVSAADYDKTNPFIEIDGRTKYYALSTWRTASNISEGTKTYHFETTTGNWDDSFDEGDLTVYFFDLGKGVLTDLEVESFKVNETEVSANIKGASRDNSLYDCIQDADAAAGSRQSIVVADADHNTTIPANSTVSLDVKATFIPVTATKEGEWVKNSNGKWQISNGSTAQQLDKDLLLDLDTDIAYSDIASIQLDLFCVGSYANGSIGINDASPTWQQADFATDKSLSPKIELSGVEETAQLKVYAGWFNANTTLIINNITITKKVVDVDSVTVTPDTATLKIGEATALTAEVLPADATDPTITWTSSDETVATVDQNGKVTAKAAGTATIKAVSNADDTIYGSCEVTVEKNTYAITVKSNNDAYGTASADVEEAAEGTKVTLTAVPKTGYKFVEWKSDDVTITDNTFTMPANAVEITAVFEEKAPDEFDITIAKTANGTVTVKGGKTASVKDETIDLVITPDKGYEVDTVKVNGEAITGTSFTMPEKDVTIEVTFKKSTYTVTVAAAANGTVTADKATAQMGDTVTVTATPDTDYELSKITVNGTAITGNTFTMPAENVTIAAEFKKIGSADAEVVAPEGVSVSFAGSKEDILKAVFGDDYAALVEAGYKLDVVMTVKDETAVSAEDKALVEGALSDDMHIGLLIDVSLVMTKDGVSTVVENSSKPVSFAIGVPDSIIADGRTYSVIRVHDGAAEDIGGTYDAANKTITVSSDKYSTYAVVYKDAPAPQPEPVVTYYSITTDRNVTASASTAAAGTQINVRVDFGYDAYVYCGGRVIDKITEGSSFTMPAGNVTIVTKANGYLAMVKNAAPNSYIFVYDADMNYIKTNGSVKGIKGEGKITVKLGEEYAGKTVTLYKGRKSTSVKLESLTLDKNGNATFTVEGGKNYTAVVE